MYGINMHGDWIAEFQMFAEFRKDAKGAVLQHRSIHTEDPHISIIIALLQPHCILAEQSGLALHISIKCPDHHRDLRQNHALPQSLSRSECDLAARPAAARLHPKDAVVLHDHLLDQAGSLGSPTFGTLNPVPDAHRVVERGPWLTSPVDEVPHNMSAKI